MNDWAAGIKTGAQHAIGAVLVVTAAAFVARRYAPELWALVTGGPTTLAPAPGAAGGGGLILQNVPQTSGGNPCG